MTVIEYYIGKKKEKEKKKNVENIETSKPEMPKECYHNTSSISNMKGQFNW